MRTTLTTFVVEALELDFKPGLDLDRMNQMVDDLEAEDVSGRAISGLSWTNPLKGQ